MLFCRQGNRTIIVKWFETCKQKCGKCTLLRVTHVVTFYLAVLVAYVLAFYLAYLSGIASGPVGVPARAVVSICAVYVLVCGTLTWRNTFLTLKHPLCKPRCNNVQEASAGPQPLAHGVFHAQFTVHTIGVHNELHIRGHDKRIGWCTWMHSDLQRVFYLYNYSWFTSRINIS